MFKKIFLTIALLIATTVSAQTFGGGTGTLNQLDQWRSTSTPFSAITTNVAGKNIYIPQSTATSSRFYTNTLCLNNTTPDCITSWAGASLVDSVSNSDGTLTISPITGDVIASLNLGHANTWTGQQTFNTSAPIFGTMTEGSVLFAGSGGVLSQDNSKLFWNNTDKRLAIGTNAPYTTSTLEVGGTTSIVDTSSLGAERLLNGSFTGSATSWTLGTGWAYSSNTVVKNSDGTGTLSQTYVGSQPYSTLVAIGQLHALTFTISDWTVGSVTPSLGGVTGTAVSANGTYTQYFLATTEAIPTFTPTNTSRFTIDNVSMKQVLGTMSAFGPISTNGTVANSSVSGAYIRGNETLYTDTNAGILQIATTKKSSTGNSNVGRGMYFGIDSRTISSLGTGYIQFYNDNSGTASGLAFNPNGGSVAVGGMPISGVTDALTAIRSSNPYIRIQNTNGSFGGPGQYMGILFHNATTGYSTYQKGAITYEGYDASGYGRGRLLFALNGVLDSSNVTADYPAYTIMNMDYVASNVSIGNGVTAGTGKLNVKSTTEQFRLYYDNSNFSAFTVDSTGRLTIDNTGSNASVTVSDALGIGGNSNGYKLRIATAGYGGFVFDQTDGAGNAYFSFQRAGVDRAGIYDDRVGTGDLVIQGNGDISFQTGGTTQRAQISSTGQFEVSTAAITAGTTYASLPSGVTGAGSSLYSFGSNFAILGGSNTTNATRKFTRWAGAHYTNAQAPIMMMILDSYSATSGDLYIGGGSSIAGSPNNIYFYTSSDTTTPTGTLAMTLNLSGNLGIGTAPSARLHLLHTGEQFRSGYDASNYWNATTGSTGATTFNAVGSGASFTFSDSVNITSSLQVDSIVNDTGLASGTYTPTLTGVTNVSATTSRQATYMRVGNTVTVAGQFDVDPTTTGLTVVGISLPVASAFTTAYQLGGAGHAPAVAGHGASIMADATNDRAQLSYVDSVGSNDTITYTFTYEVI